MIDSAALLGRDAEIGTVSASVDRALGGTGSVVVVEGEPGIGKTALVDAVADLAGRRGLPTFRARATAMDQRRPFGILQDALGVRPDAPMGRRRAVADLLAAADPSGDSQNAEGRQFAVGEELLALIDDLAGSQPAVVIAEDLHWADPASLGVLARLARSTSDLPVVLLATMRPLPRRPELVALLRDLPASAASLNLGPLGADDVIALAEAQARSRLGPRLQAGLRAVPGNPLFVREVMSGLLTDGAVVIGPDGTADVSDGEMLPSMTAAILDHLSFLTPRAIQLLGVAAVLGSTFSISALTALTSLPAAEVRAVLDEAELGDVLVAAGDDHLAFRHDLIHEVFYDDLAPAVRRALHTDAAAVLDQAGAEVAAVAEHVLRSATSRSSDAVAFLRRAAADAAATGAPGVAVDLIEAAIDPPPADPALAQVLRAELGIALVTAGRTDEGEAVLRSIVDATSADGGNPARADHDAAVREALVHALMLQGRIGEACAEAAAAAVAPGIGPVDRARFAARASLAPVMAGDWLAAEAAGRDALAAAVAVGDVAAEVLAGLTLAHVDNLRGNWRAALEHTTRATDLAAGDPSRLVQHNLPFHLHAAVLLELDEMTSALAACDTGLREAERHGLADAVATSYFVSGAVHFWSGDWDEAIAANEIGVRLAAEVGVSWQADLLCELALLRCWQGRLSDARELLTLARVRAASGGGHYRTAWLPWVAGMLEEAAGHDDRALAHLAAGWRETTAKGARIESRHLGPPLARLAAGAGRDDLAADVADEIEALARTNDSAPGLVATARRVRGLASGDPGVLLDALDLHRAGPRPHDTARCAEETACALAVSGRQDEARTIALEALERYTDIGAEGEVARARAAFRRAGLHLGVRGPRKRPADGWSALTPTEIEIAHRVAQQMSNPEIAQAMFLSRRTVAHHVSSVLAKLRMSSRAEIVAATADGSLESR